MMKRIRLLITIGVLAFSVAIAAGVKVRAETDIPPGLEETIEDGQSWLAQQLEQIGVPAGITALIVSVGVSLGILIVTKFFKKIGKNIIDALFKLNLTNEAINKYIDKLGKIEEKLDAIENDAHARLQQTIKNDLQPAILEVKALYNEVKVMKEHLYNGSLKIIKLLNSSPADSTDGEDEAV